jgi:hypothetical protein
MAPSFLISALDVVSGQLHAPAALPQGNHPRYPMCRRLGGQQSQSRASRGCEVETIFAPAGNRTQHVQPVARRYTD